ncbi:MAG: hypothetical protein JWO06_2316 [Bacteroidota bacterium]|nr:hypothetical protein [Bacteroidota bacterium]
MHYEITQRFKDGAVKQVGEFSTNCIGEKHRKHGYFISYNKQGRETSRKIYFYDHRRNKKFLGIKIGWWGFYLENDFYVLGVITKRRIIDPCF